MTRILVDTNVILDVLLDRRPHAEASVRACSAVETGAAEGFVAAHAITTIHYLARKELGTAKATGIVARLMRVFRVAAVDHAVIQDAMQLSCPDFEDAVTAAAARISGCGYIVTRDPKAFRGSPARCLTPEMALPILKPS